MNLYPTGKALHLLSSVLLVGTGFGSAFYLFFVHRTRSVPVIAAVLLYVLAGACWLPVVWLQLELTKMARIAHQNQLTELPSRYWQFAKSWERLGYPAFVAMIGIYLLMVIKPA